MSPERHRAALHRAAPPGAAPHHGGCGSPPIPSPRATPHRRAGSERALTETRYETKPCYVKMPRGLRAERGGPQPLTWHRIQRRRRLRLRRPVAPRLGTQLWHARVRRLWPRSGLGTEGEELPVGAQHGAGGGEAGWALGAQTLAQQLLHAGCPGARDWRLRAGCWGYREWGRGWCCVAVFLYQDSWDGSAWGRLRGAERSAAGRRGLEGCGAAGAERWQAQGCRRLPPHWDPAGAGGEPPRAAGNRTG